MATIDTRTSYFEKGVASWRRLTGTAQDVYVCPICEKEFDRVALDARELTIEHVPPESLGGKEMTLTCKTCNNLAGYTIDAEAHRREQLRLLGRAVFQKVGDYSGRARLEIDGVPLNVQIEIVEGRRPMFSVEQAHNDPEDFRTQMDHLRSMHAAGKVNEVAMTLTARTRFHIRHSQVSDLRSAYLAAFAGFGYAYAMQPKLDPIRSQIRKHDEKIVENAWLLRPKDFPEENVILWLHAPARGLAVFVGMTVVILPWFNSPDDLYDAVAAGFDPNRALTLEGEVLGWPTGMEMVVDATL